jgi:hypothetical protein
MVLAPGFSEEAVKLLFLLPGSGLLVGQGYGEGVWPKRSCLCTPFCQQHM